MADRPFIESIKIENLLSFPPGSPEIKLERLNVLIGPNGSGKSNLVDIIGLLRDAPTDMLRRMRLEGGWKNWAWLGGEYEDPATLEVFVTPSGMRLMRWGLDIGIQESRIVISDEFLELPELSKEDDRHFLYRREKGKDVLIFRVLIDSNKPDQLRTGYLSSFDRQQSIFSQIKDPVAYPAMDILSASLSSVSIYRKFPIERPGTLRRPQPTDLPSSFLDFQATNLNLILNNIYKPPTREVIRKYIGELYPLARGISFEVMGNTIQLFLEEGDEGRLIPATRLSDGTMQYLCLLAILCHPDPPPLICLEEPEVGLHPDLINALGRLLVEASERTQLIVTTHSEALVSALSDQPQYVVVCENHGQGTEMRRLDPEQLAGWLERYTLGDLWAKGEIGGNRW